MRNPKLDPHFSLREYVKAERFRIMLERCGAYLEGHFVSSSSGLHFARFFDMQRAFQHHLICDIFALNLYMNLPENIRRTATLLVGPERGAWPLLLTLAHYLPNEEVRTLPIRKKEGGGFELPKNAVVKDNDQVLLVDDVITTGKTMRAVIELFDSNPIIAAGFGVNRAPVDWDAVKNFPSIPVVYVFRDPQDQFTPEKCPLCQAGVKLISM